MGSREEEGRSLAETPTWAVATVITFMVTIGFLIHGGLVKFGKWLDRTKRKQLLAALDKIKEELMVFGLLSLLMGHWIVFVAKICVKSSAVSSRFYPCVASNYVKHEGFENQAVDLRSNHLNSSTARSLLEDVHQGFCPQDHQPFASYESLEQLHRLLFVLGITHVSYSFLAVALALIKIYSWRTWENHAKTMALRGLLTTDTSAAPEDRGKGGVRMKRLTTFISHHTSHPWSQHRLLVWLLCFSRQFWSSINQADYTALRLGFLTTHQLPFTYDFHNYMLRSMEEEFRDIVGISIPLWIFAITCIVLGFHGTNIYFWVSFLPAILILLVGTKLHRIVVKLAVEVVDSSHWTGFEQFNLRDELFWFGNPRLLLRLIQFILFQNAFEMATYIWSMWEIKDSSCFIGDRTFLITRLIFGIVSQFWCSFITFPLYVIVAQMGSKFKKTIISENVRKSLHGWRRKVKTRHGGQPFRMLTVPSSVDEGDKNFESVSSTKGGYSTRFEGRFMPNQNLSSGQSERNEISSFNEKLQDQVCSAPQDEYSNERYGQEIKPSDDVEEIPVLPSKEQPN
ncbi:MLO-like protein 4 [Sesamum indicum]|uniref:MLO-like protein n=1 Tax=Sesamum indicum TaxID=4182 RepID=A0A6I9U1B4_SESIN|nr:MLO-like protein 4 [Sesamum indicum]